MGREQCVSSGEAVVSTDGLTHTRRRIQGTLWYPWIRGTPGYAVPLDTTVPLDITWIRWCPWIQMTPYTSLFIPLQQ